MCAYGDCITFLKSNNSNILNLNRLVLALLVRPCRGLRLEKLSAYFVAVKCYTHNLFVFAVALSLGTNYDNFPCKCQISCTLLSVTNSKV